MEGMGAGITCCSCMQASAAAKTPAASAVTTAASAVTSAASALTTEAYSVENACSL